MTPWSAARCPTIRGALARSSSAASGFFFCGMIDEPDRPGVGQLAEAELLRLDQSTSSAPRRERCVAQVAAACR